MGWVTAMRRRFNTHRIWMRFSYAMTFGAVTLRLQIPLGLLAGYHSYGAKSVWLAYTSWISNVIAVAISTLWMHQKSPAHAVRDPSRVRSQDTRTPFPADSTRERFAGGETGMTTHNG
ncbi:MAG: DUF2306 domain-containing protein [Alphaproteobacteria bacterium]|nr:DUF2306 domain-containing protein [Alphaproteobacteria bacterium]